MRSWPNAAKKKKKKGKKKAGWLSRLLFLTGQTGKFWPKRQQNILKVTSGLWKEDEEGALT